MEASNVVQGQELDNSPKYLMVKSDQLEGRVSKVEETMQGMVKEIQQMKSAFHRFAKMVSCYIRTSHCWPLFQPAFIKSHTLILESTTASGTSLSHNQRSSFIYVELPSLMMAFLKTHDILWYCFLMHGLIYVLVTWSANKIDNIYPRSLNISLHLTISDFARRRQSLKSKCSQK